MKTFTSIDTWLAYRESLSVAPIGFVPTMGALHEGHLSLFRKSLQDNAMTIVSIFVNPNQFDEGADYQAYPRDHRADLELLEKLGVDAVILPDAEQVYIDGYRFRVAENDFSRRLCGAHRPGHFDGVLTVVMRLLNIVRPQHAYFGEKDFQQLRLVRDMVAAFFMPVKIIACATVREADGLALSSRNRRLDPLQRQQAPALYAALKSSRSAESTRELLTAQGFEVDYVKDLTDRRLAAARLGDTRLIDNVPL